MKRRWTPAGESRPETGSLHPMALEVGCFSVTKSRVFLESPVGGYENPVINAI
jgi:hypothetical protein